MHNKFDIAYLRMAKNGQNSLIIKESRLVLSHRKDRMIISDGYNGTPSGAEKLLANTKKVKHIGMFCIKPMLF